MSAKKPVSSAMKASLKAKRKETGAIVPCKNPPPVTTTEMTPIYESLLPEFLMSLRNGVSVTKFARANGVTAGQLRSWVWRHHRDEYEAAQREGADLLAEMAVEVASNSNMVEETVETTFADGSTTTAVKRFDNTQRSKLAVEGLWKLAAAKDPEKYGNKPVSSESSSIASEIIAARKRVQGS